MQPNKEKVIIFPKWKTNLEQSGMQAMERKNYKEALEMFNQLLQFQVKHHEIMLGKLICLMELGEMDEAQQLCEERMQAADEHYYEYVQIYLTLLFQTDQYEAVLEQIELERLHTNVPNKVLEQFNQFYELSEHMNNDSIVNKSNVYAQELKQAIREQDEKKQVQFIRQLRKLHYPPSADIVHMLVDTAVHPVIKTAILHWLKEVKYNEKIEIHKFDRTMIVQPNTLIPIKEHPIHIETLECVNSLEEKNPTMYTMIEQLLYRYFFVKHPFCYEKPKIEQMATALMYLAETYLNIPTKNSKMLTEETSTYVEEIKLYNALYLSVIEE
ncbi:tetratricopeptide repeat protein [Virgibacillus sp. W0430]|uniref:tetratricopeptide repeat protein n=1 Tax=Virgibacillus sp. W0430 TaxID=3391580 RepID=UPI003F44D8AF